MKKIKAFDVTSFLTDAQREQAIQEYILKHPELVEQYLKDYIKDYVRNSFARVMYDDTKAAYKKFDSFRNTITDSITKVSDTIIHDTEFMATVFDESKAEDLMKKAVKEHFDNAHTYRWHMNDIITKNIPDMLKGILMEDEELKSFRERVRSTLKEKIANTTVEKEVERLMRGMY